MPENQSAIRSVAESGAGDARPATLGDIRHLENSLRADMRELRDGQWKIIGIAIVVLPVMLEVVPMIFDLLRG